MWPEFGREFPAMRALHDENGVRPIKQLRCDRIFGVVIEPRRCGFDAGPIRKNGFSRRTAQPVPAANEQDVFDQRLTPMRCYLPSQLWIADGASRCARPDT